MGLKYRDLKDTAFYLLLWHHLLSWGVRSPRNHNCCWCNSKAHLPHTLASPHQSCSSASSRRITTSNFWKAPLEPPQPLTGPLRVQYDACDCPDIILNLPLSWEAKTVPSCVCTPSLADSSQLKQCTLPTQHVVLGKAESVSSAAFSTQNFCYMEHYSTAFSFIGQSGLVIFVFWQDCFFSPASLSPFFLWPF